ncbi:MAG TPA: sigma-70 family RNA polymerase sigma factor [Membranihabitans sp.]|nr:sigma-70 family RNA polymerase sigma factor [Membranihabitans sp.]
MTNHFESRFEEIYNQHLDQVFHYVYSIVHHEPTAEDITADVFFTVWKKRSTLLGYENIPGLLFKISRDLSFNYLKSLSKNAKKKNEFLHHYFGIDAGGDEYLFREYQLTTLERAIDQLPEKCREVVKMKFLLGQSLKEISSELQISVNTVQNHLARGKSIIKEIMNTDEAFFILILIIPGLW